MLKDYVTVTFSYIVTFNMVNAVIIRPGRGDSYDKSHLDYDRTFLDHYVKNVDARTVPGFPLARILLLQQSCRHLTYNLLQFRCCNSQFRLLRCTHDIAIPLDRNVRNMTMASKKRAQKPAPAEAVTAEATVAEATTPVAAPAPVVITITEKVAKLGGTRKLWYDAIKAYNGKTLAEFLASDLPALPPKGSVKGRIRFLVREGLITLA